MAGLPWLRAALLTAAVAAAATAGAGGAGDAAALLQTASSVSAGPAEGPGQASGISRKVDGKKEIVKDDGKQQAASFRTGEQAEVVVLKGEQAGTWIPCMVLAKEKHDTYIIHMPSANTTLEDIPAWALRKIPPELDVNKDVSDGVLLFWAVGSKDYTIDLVKQNIDHLRKTYAGPADVFLAHYDGQQDAWKSRDETWYTTNVRFSGLKKWKVKRTKSAGFPPQLVLAMELLPEILKGRQYRWVWLLDEAIDFRTTNVTKLFADAFRTNALIAAPTVTLGNRTGELVDQIAYGECGPQYVACKVHTPNPECSYRYVNFVDMMFPLVHPRALTEIYGLCSNCMDHIDHIWCSKTARQLKKSEKTACAILDKVTVGHINSASLKKLSAKVQLKKDEEIQSFREHFVNNSDIQTLRCVK